MELNPPLIMMLPSEVTSKPLLNFAIISPFISQIEKVFSSSFASFGSLFTSSSNSVSLSPTTSAGAIFPLTERVESNALVAIFSDVTAPSAILSVVIRALMLSVCSSRVVFIWAILLPCSCNVCLSSADITPALSKFAFGRVMVKDSLL